MRTSFRRMFMSVSCDREWRPERAEVQVDPKTLDPGGAARATAREFDAGLPAVCAAPPGPRRRSGSRPREDHEDAEALVAGEAVIRAGRDERGLALVE